jgi:hypothetical protein
MPVAWNADRRRSQGQADYWNPTGIIQVVVRDVWDNRRGRPKQRPTIGADRAPVDTRPGAEPE